MAQNLHVAFHQQLWHREKDIKNYAPRHFCKLSRVGTCYRDAYAHKHLSAISNTMCIS